MRPVDRIWFVSFLLGWALLIFGWFAHSTWAIGAALLLFLVFAVERWDNLKRGRG